ncbi:hypothetical protein [Phyllobacterium sp. SB3]|uniref:hypothetical protein n=1 Tax=Phyllobacterium sp. SB3 TaxID=3156073 RepID=UPI0032AF4AA6
MKKLSTVIAISSTLLVAGCGTYNGWTPRKTDTTPSARSCASGYWDCSPKGQN